jgi:hypothetical protein
MVSSGIYSPPFYRKARIYVDRTAGLLFAEPTKKKMELSNADIYSPATFRIHPPAGEYVALKQFQKKAPVSAPEEIPRGTHF